MNAIPLAAGAAGPMASVREQINVRSGPGLGFEGIGLLSAKDAVSLTGRDSGGTWLQIAFGEDGDERAWVAASFLESVAADALPIVSDEGEILGTSTPAASAPASRTEPATAHEDGDSLTGPAIDVRFSPAGAGSAFYSSDLSAPAGDNSDWIQFHPYYDVVTVRLECEGSAELAVELVHEGVVESAASGIECGTSQVLDLGAGSPFVLRIFIPAAGATQRYSRYTVSLFAIPAR
jgi:uncharacterized protein YraI